MTRFECRAGGGADEGGIGDDDAWRARRPRAAETGRGVSDVLGFAIVFAVVVLSVTLLYTFGLGALRDVQHAEAMENGERAFDVLGDNLADVHAERAPSRSTELQFGGGQLSTTGAVGVVVNVSGGPTADYTLVPVSYRNRETGFHYVSGAVVRTERDAAVLVREPPFSFDDDRVVLSLVDTRATGTTTSIGSGTVRVTGRRLGQSELAVVATGVSTVNVSVTTPRHEAWARYFRDRGCATVTVDDAAQTVTCEFATDAVYVRRTPVGVELAP